ncbi:uncharacterized protein LOC131242227 [Magnolia sinica]|uniref:uncharacterized protein LOC131242227 n=1 Tax=Magnolia sinica TaxID=86752 RepID=UPI002659947B|nr:uncharacterized protein LOC131242227 [Magnolia sinica]
MQIVRHLGKPVGRQTPAKPSISGRLMENGLSYRNNNPASRRHQFVHAGSVSKHPSPIRSSRYQSVVPSERRLRKHPGEREILRRALSPPVRQSPNSGTRRWNFRHTPSRLCNMSMS